MAVYTEVSDEALRAFLARYELGEVISFKGIAEGVENSNFLMRHAARPLHPHPLREARERGGSAVLHRPDGASGRKRASPARSRCATAPARRSAGSPAGRGDRDFSRRAVDSPPQRVAIAAQVGEALARMHKAGADFELQRANALSIGGWPALLRAAGGARRRSRARASRRKARRSWPCSRRIGRATCPSGVIHADLFPDNVFFLGDELSGLIDFYFACNDALAYDLAICLNAWCFEPDGAFNITKGMALINGYERVRRLDRGRESRRCRCWRAARRCASC